jgi:hypothetical protein
MLCYVGRANANGMVIWLYICTYGSWNLNVVVVVPVVNKLHVSSASQHVYMYSCMGVLHGLMDM